MLDLKPSVRLSWFVVQEHGVDLLQFPLTKHVNIQAQLAGHTVQDQERTWLPFCCVASSVGTFSISVTKLLLSKLNQLRSRDPYTYRSGTHVDFSAADVPLLVTALDQTLLHDTHSVPAQLKRCGQEKAKRPSTDDHVVVRLSQGLIAVRDHLWTLLLWLVLHVSKHLQQERREQNMIDRARHVRNKFEGIRMNGIDRQ